MTAQVTDRIEWNGQEHALGADPLRPLLAASRSAPRFVGATTANWRGYVSWWEIRDGSLYLTRLQGSVDRSGELLPQSAPPRDWSTVEPATLADLFPDRDPPILADWFTGELPLRPTGVAPLGAPPTAPTVVLSVADGRVVGESPASSA